MFLHNGTGYDFHFIINEIIKLANDRMKINVLAKTKENYIGISIGNHYRKLVFLDSYQLSNKNLSDITKSIEDNDFIVKKKILWETTREMSWETALGDDLGDDFVRGPWETTFGDDLRRLPLRRPWKRPW